MQVGPLIDESAVAKVERHVADATGTGAELVRGGRRLEGTFFEPTVLTGVDGSMAMTREETFGPVAGIRASPPRRRRSGSRTTRPYGLAAYFYSRASAASGASRRGSSTGSSASTPGSSRPRWRRSAA